MVELRAITHNGQKNPAQPEVGECRRFSCFDDTDYFGVSCVALRCVYTGTVTA